MRNVPMRNAERGMRNPCRQLTPLILRRQLTTRIPHSAFRIPHWNVPHSEVRNLKCPTCLRPKKDDITRLGRLGLREFAGLRRTINGSIRFGSRSMPSLLVPISRRSRRCHLRPEINCSASAKDKWSGGAASLPLPDGKKLIILNPTHGEEPAQRDADGRDQPRLPRSSSQAGSRWRLATSRGRSSPATTTPRSKKKHTRPEPRRSFRIRRLKRMVETGKTSAEIARHFDVSRRSCRISHQGLAVVGRLTKNTSSRDNPPMRQSRTPKAFQTRQAFDRRQAADAARHHQDDQPLARSRRGVEPGDGHARLADSVRRGRHLSDRDAASEADSPYIFQIEGHSRLRDQL